MHNYILMNYYFSLILRWTGSNTNPHNNDGQGLAGTDRSNIVLLRTVNYPEGTRGRAVPLGMENGHWGNSYPAQLDDDETFLGLSRQLREDLALLTPSMSNYFVGKCPFSKFSYNYYIFIIL